MEPKKIYYKNNKPLLNSILKITFLLLSWWAILYFCTQETKSSNPAIQTVDMSEPDFEEGTPQTMERFWFRLNFLPSGIGE